MVPSANWPLTRRVRGPAAAEKTGGALRGGRPSATSSSFTYRPAVVSRSPFSRPRSACRYSVSSVSGEPARAPTWPIQSCTPWPTPTVTRPGNMRSSAAASIAVSATFRNGTGSTPIPTASRSVQASSADASVIAPPQKQSSQSQSSASPASSAARATSRSRSGGTWGSTVAASIVMALIMPVGTRRLANRTVVAALRL
jgi:hypothetical protein